MSSPYTDAETCHGFAIRNSPSIGRHLVATRAFATGGLILQQDPYAAVLLDDHTPGYCDFCFRACERPLRCSRSKLARYCCKEHQRLAWTAGYKQECEALVRCAPRVPPPTVRLAARILWRRARAPQQGRQPPEAPPVQPQQQSPQPPPLELHAFHQPPLDSDHEGLWRLEHHWDQLDDRRKEMYAQMAVVTWQFMFGTPGGPCPVDIEGAGDAPTTSTTPASSSNPPFSTAAAEAAWPGFRAVAQLLSRLACNCHSICDEELRPVGVGLYPTGALVNHSCRPSAVQGFRGSTLQLRALKPLSPGDEITIAYVDLAATRQERREALADGYFFDTDIAAEGYVPSPATVLAAAAAAPAPAAVSSSLAAPPSGEAGAAMKVDGAAVGLSRGSEGAGDAGGGPAGCGGGEAGRGPPAGPLQVRPPPVLNLEVAANAQLFVYSTVPEQPPWPTDPWDGDLTTVECRGGGGGGGGGGGDKAGPSDGGPGSAVGVGWGQGQGGRLAGGAVRLAGGLLARLVPKRPHEPAEEGDDDEEQEQEQEEEAGNGSSGACNGPGIPWDDDVDMAEAAVAVGSRSVGTEALAAGAPAGHVAGSPQRPHLRLDLPGSARSGGSRGGSGAKVAHWPQIELLAWGPWVSELARAAADAGAGSSLAPVATAAADGQVAGEGSGAVAGGAGGGAAGGAGGSSLGAPASRSEVAALLRRCVHSLHLAHQAEAAKAAGDTGEAMDLLLRAVELLDGRVPPRPVGPPSQHPARGTPNDATPDQAVVLGPNHILRTRLQAQLLKAAIDHGSSSADNGNSEVGSASSSGGGGGVWEVALRAARALDTPYGLVYGQAHWPARSLHFATLAKLEMLTGRPCRALRASSRALEGLRVTHVGGAGSSGEAGCGGGGGVVDQVVQVWREAEAELQAQQARGETGMEDDDSD